MHDDDDDDYKTNWMLFRRINDRNKNYFTRVLCAKKLAQKE